MRMQKRGNIPTTTKLHFKLYKAGKLWLVAGLTSIAIIAGLGFTTAQAATDDSASQNPSGQVAGTAQGADDSDNGLNNSTGSEDKPSDNPTSDPNKSTANDQSGQLINSESSLSQIHGSTYDGSAQGLIGAAPASKSTTSQIAAYDASLPTTFDLPDDTTTLTAKTGADSDGNVVTGTALSTLPVLSNFYVNVTGGGYIPYDAKAMVGLVPYDAENFTTFPQDVFGFYVILPETITANLLDVRTSAANYVTALRANINPSTGLPYVDIKSLTVYRLKDTNDGRQVYYFKPNDGATFTAKQPGAVGYGGQIHMYTLVSTGKSTGATTEPTTLTFNNPAGKDGNLPIHDVLFMGVGDQDYKGNGDDYIGYNAVDAFGNNAEDWPDTNLVSIYANNGAATKSDNFGKLTYINVTVNDHLNVYSPTDASGKRAIQRGLSVYINNKDISDNKPGVTYNLSSQVEKLNMPPRRYWLDSLQYEGYSTSNYTPQTLPTTVTLEPTSLDLPEGSTTAPGKTYNFFINLIQTALKSSNATYHAGPNNGWKPADTLTGIAPDGSVLDVDGSLDPNSQVAKDLGTLALTITDAAGQVVTQDQLTKPGTYTVKYTYTDIQGNIGSYLSGPALISTVAEATITVLPTASSLAVTNKTLTAGDSWTPADNITALSGVDGTSADIAAALAGTNSDGSKATVTITNSKGETVDPAALDLKTPATYQLAYTYTDANGNTITSEQVSLTIKAPVNNSGTTGTTTNPTTPNQPTMPAKPTAPGNPTTGKTPAKVTKTPHTTTKRHPRTTTGKLAATGYPTTTGTTQRTATNFNGSPATFVTDPRRPSSSTSSTRLPQTGEQADAWAAELGLVLLALTGSLALRRKQD